MLLLVPAYPGCPGQTAVKWLLLVVGAGVVICLEQGADLHMVQLMPLPLTVFCFSTIQIGFTFLVLAYPGSLGQGPLNGCVCVRVCVHLSLIILSQFGDFIYVYK